MTSVSREVLPVVAIDGRAGGDGRVGAATRAVMAAFAALVAREAEPLGDGSRGRRRDSGPAQRRGIVRPPST